MLINIKMFAQPMKAPAAQYYAKYCVTILHAVFGWCTIAKTQRRIYYEN